jgi:hypothetical protein
MLISLHEQGTTTPKIRAAIRASDKPASLVTEPRHPDSAIARNPLRYGTAQSTRWA